MYLQTPLRLPEFFPIGQWNRFEQTEVRHLTNPLALKFPLKLVSNGNKVSLMGFYGGCNVIFSNHAPFCSVAGFKIRVRNGGLISVIQ